jgi:hypothetical protein
MNIYDALKAQPKLADEAGYKAWIENDDLDALNEALSIWGFGPMNEDGDIEDEE